MEYVPLSGKAGGLNEAEAAMRPNLRILNPWTLEVTSWADFSPADDIQSANVFEEQRRVEAAQRRSELAQAAGLLATPVSSQLKPQRTSVM